jgi:hypothetical protein
MRRTVAPVGNAPLESLATRDTPPKLNGVVVWSLEEKLRLVAESERPGSSIAEVARRYEVSRGLLACCGTDGARCAEISEAANGNGTKRLEACSATEAVPAVSGCKIEITLPPRCLPQRQAYLRLSPFHDFLSANSPCCVGW